MSTGRRAFALSCVALGFVCLRRAEAQQQDCSQVLVQQVLRQTSSQSFHQNVEAFTSLTEEEVFAEYQQTSRGGQIDVVIAGIPIGAGYSEEAVKDIYHSVKRAYQNRIASDTNLTSVAETVSSFLPANQVDAWRACVEQNAMVPTVKHEIVRLEGGKFRLTLRFSNPSIKWDVLPPELSAQDPVTFRDLKETDAGHFQAELSKWSPGEAQTWHASTIVEFANNKCSLGYVCVTFAKGWSHIIPVSRMDAVGELDIMVQDMEYEDLTGGEHNVTLSLFTVAGDDSRRVTFDDLAERNVAVKTMAISQNGGTGKNWPQNQLSGLGCKAKVLGGENTLFIAYRIKGHGSEHYDRPHENECVDIDTRDVYCVDISQLGAADKTVRIVRIPIYETVLKPNTRRAYWSATLAIKRIASDTQ